MLKFSINKNDFYVIEVNRPMVANGFAIFKCENDPTKINYPIAVAQSPIDLQRVLKNLFLTEVFKPMIQR